MRVLIVDDSSLMRLMLKGLLRQMNIPDVCEARDGQEALSALNAGNFDLVVLDIHMPVMDGVICLEIIRKTPSMANVAVIVCSSDSDPVQVEKALALGAVTYVKKPFQIDGLRNALTHVPVRAAC